MNKRPSSPRYKFSVYIARETRMSDLAVERLTKICEENIPGEYQIEVIDIAKRPDLARNQDIVATPAVFRTLPAPLRKSIGDLSDKDKAILGLDLLKPSTPQRTPTRGRRAVVLQAAD
jgi:circadian clock protein KaiB